MMVSVTTTLLLCNSCNTNRSCGMKIREEEGNSPLDDVFFLVLTIKEEGTFHQTRTCFTSLLFLLLHMTICRSAV